MKLVNVEDLKVLVAVESKGEIRYGKLVTDLFDDISTVEAIPIEWIEEWGWKNGMSESMSLRVMIDDWEKENEAV